MLRQIPTVESVTIAPNFISSLNYAAANYDTVDGQIHVKWERAGENIEIRIQKADGVHGNLELPRGYVLKHVSGTEDKIADDRRFYELKNAVYTVCKKG